MIFTPNLTIIDTKVIVTLTAYDHSIKLYVN